jgi:8-oxo-dGTP pyrophosphatase MutT (NUDIX family)
MDISPSIASSFVYRGKTIQLEWYDLVGQDLPDLPWQQIYVIGDVEGLVPVVRYDSGDKDNLPGGKVESGESPDETIKREIKEEVNCKVLAWSPIGYQKLTEPDGRVVYQLRVAARLEKLGKFVNDIGGAVVGYKLVEIDTLNSHIQYDEVGERMVELTKRVRKNDYGNPGPGGN